MSGIQIPYRTLDWHSSHRRRSLPKSKAGRSCAVLCGIRVLRTAHGCGRSSYMGSWRYGLRLRAPPTARLSIPANLEYSYARLQLSIISPPLHFACPNMLPLGRRRLLAGITSSSCRSYVVCCTPYVKFIVQAPSTSHFIAEQETLGPSCAMHYALCMMHDAYAYVLRRLLQERSDAMVVLNNPANRDSRCASLLPRASCHHGT